MASPPLALPLGEKKRNPWPYLFVSPYFILYFIFGLFPVLFSLYLSFMDWDGIGEKSFIGLQNYVRLVQDQVFLRSLWNTAFIIIVYISLQLIAGLILAAILHSGYVKLKRFFQVALFLPYITTPVAVGLLFALFFDWQSGLINRFFAEIGLWTEGINWLGTPGGARFVLILMMFWKGFGYCIMIYSVGLAAISKDLYEAAAVDGAKPHQVFFAITVPLLKPVTLFLLVTSVIYGFQLLDEPMLLLAGWASGAPLVGGPERCCFTPVWYLYDITFSSNNKFGYGASIAYGLFLVIFAFSLISIKFSSGGRE